MQSYLAAVIQNDKSVLDFPVLRFNKDQKFFTTQEIERTMNKTIRIRLWRNKDGPSRIEFFENNYDDGQLVTRCRMDYHVAGRIVSTSAFQQATEDEQIDIFQAKLCGFWFPLSYVYY
jgi:hypothetical protein